MTGLAFDDRRNESMPNWTYLTLHFLHTAALGIWIGGMVAVGIVAAPAVFRTASSRQEAGRIMSAILRRFDAVVMGCILFLWITSPLLVAWFGRLSPWYAIEYVCIAMMSASAIYSARVVAPRLRRLRAEGRTSGDAQFDQLHRASVLSMQFNLACGALALLFS